MKDHVKNGHLTKYDAFRISRDQAMNLEICFKSIPMPLILRPRPPKQYKLFKF